MHIHDLLTMIESIAPPSCAVSWDRGGVQVAADRQFIQRVAVGLDAAPDTVDRALAWGADFLLVHHPLTMKPDLPSRLGFYHHVLTALTARNAWLYAAHTSLDTQPDGPVQWLARELGLSGISVLEPTGRRVARWYRILGRPNAIASLTRKLGEAPNLELYCQSDSSLEVICPADRRAWLQDAIAREEDGFLRTLSQDLESPAVSVGFGYVGDLPKAVSWDAFVRELEQVLQQPLRTIAGIVPDHVARVACCPGSGASLLSRAGQSGAQVYITGDFKYHDAQAVHELGFLVADVGHFVLEERMMRILADDMRFRLRDYSVEVEFFPGGDAFAHVH